MARVYRSRSRRGNDTSSAWAWVIGGIAVIVLILIFAPLFSDDDELAPAEPGVAQYERDDELFEEAPTGVTGVGQDQGRDGQDLPRATNQPPRADQQPGVITVYTMVIDPNAPSLAGQQVDLQDLRVTRKVSDTLFYVEPANVPGHRPFLIETERARELYPNQVVSVTGELKDPTRAPDIQTQQLSRDERLALSNAPVYLDAQNVRVAPETRISRNQPEAPTARQAERDLREQQRQMDEPGAQRTRPQGE